MDFVSNPALLGFFATFAAGVTQIVKRQLGLENTLHIQGVSVVAFVLGVFLHYTLPDVWQVMFDVVAGGAGVTGGVGLAKEFIEGKKD